MKDQNFTNMEAASVAEVTPRTVINICQYYESGGLESALNDDPRPGQPPKFDDRIKSHIVAMICSEPPDGFDRWTLELIKEEAEKRKITDGISKEAARLILKEHDLKPWQYKMWCVPELTDEYVDRMNAILDLYERDYDGKNPVVCVDEKPVVMFGDIRQPMKFSEGQPNKYDYQYSRNGATNVFCGVEPKKGRYFTEVTKNKKKYDFAKFMKSVYDTYKYSKKIHLVMDNYSTHFKNSFVESFGKREGEKMWKKFEVHYTPSHASWLNQAEIAIGMYSRQCLGKTRISDIMALKKKTQSWTRIINEKAVVINWSFTKKDAKEKFGL